MYYFSEFSVLIGFGMHSSQCFMLLFLFLIAIKIFIFQFKFNPYHNNEFPFIHVFLCLSIFQSWEESSIALTTGLHFAWYLIENEMNYVRHLKDRNDEMDCHSEWHFNYDSYSIICYIPLMEQKRRSNRTFFYANNKLEFINRKANEWRSNRMNELINSNESEKKQKLWSKRWNGNCEWKRSKNMLKTLLYYYYLQIIANASIITYFHFPLLTWIADSMVFYFHLNLNELFLPWRLNNYCIA